jgi:hypothetical protein
MSTNKQHTLSVIWLREGFYFLFLQEQIKDIIIIMWLPNTETSPPNNLLIFENTFE